MITWLQISPRCIHSTFPTDSHNILTCLFQVPHQHILSLQIWLSAMLARQKHLRFFAFLFHVSFEVLVLKYCLAVFTFELRAVKNVHHISVYVLWSSVILLAHRAGAIPAKPLSDAFTTGELLTGHTLARILYHFQANRADKVLIHRLRATLFRAQRGIDRGFHSLHLGRDRVFQLLIWRRNKF